ncbi:hypothetical protein EDD18DRAFT_1387570 [Armillaria luteobubalina]|uniref:F-box domain-containing protein n=1 Tax=Armillaria luteobubalina TaxID=153913 RepID=A0AA39P1R4_9AGAR|nr:hypothetical protein EDD18DRAFT_1387570 [Armillaria luteobubalina]
MSSQSRHLTFQDDVIFNLGELPLELFEEIASYLDILSLEALSLTSSIHRAVCIRLLFHTLTLYGDHGHSSTSNFVEDLENQSPVASFRKVMLEGVKEDLSEGLLPWCTRVHNVKLRWSLVGNTAILPTLIFLNDLELNNIIFPSMAEYFGLLAGLSPTLKRLRAHSNTFIESQSICHSVGRGTGLKVLDTRSGDDLTLRLRDDCPISLKLLQVFHARHARPHDVEDLLRRTPSLVDLSIEFKRRGHRPVSFPLARLKLLSIRDRTEYARQTIQLLSAPSDVPYPLQTFAFTCFVYNDLRKLVTALSKPTFRSVKEIYLRLLAPRYIPINECFFAFNANIGRFKRMLEAKSGRKISLNTRLAYIDPSEILSSSP